MIYDSVEINNINMKMIKEKCQIIASLSKWVIVYGLLYFYGHILRNGCFLDVPFTITGHIVD